MQRKGASPEQINSVLGLLELKAWAIVALLEVDHARFCFSDDGEFRNLPDSGHMYARHYSGPGTWAY